MANLYTPNGVKKIEDVDIINYINVLNKNFIEIKKENYELKQKIFELKFKPKKNIISKIIDYLCKIRTPRRSK